MHRSTVIALVTSSLVLGAGAAAQRGPLRAKNVILFLGDAGGTSTLMAASIYGHNEAQALFIQHMPYIGLSETSSINSWVTDSAAGMTAIVTGQKTANGVISELPPEAGKDGPILKTILEYAEDQGLSTGVISNMPMADATPAACYAHCDDRMKWGEIFAQLMHPRYGDGVDLVLGAGWTHLHNDTRKLGIDLDADLKKAGYAVYASPEEVPATARRVVGLTDNAEFDLPAVTQRAIDILSRNPKGFFLMVECDMHTSNVKSGLEHVLEMDKMVRQTADRLRKDTLILFTADHSFDLRIRGGKKGEPILPAYYKAGDPGGSLRMENGHTGEQVLVAAQGPGSDEVHGYMVNTDLFHVMMRAYGFEKVETRSGALLEGSHPHTGRSAVRSH